MQYVQMREKPTRNTGVFYFFIARGPILFFVVFFKTQSSYLKIFMCVWEDRRFLYIVLWNFFFSTLLHSHTSFSMGQNDSGFLYNHQLTNPQGLSMARLMITFRFSKIWGENYINFISADEATWLYLKPLSVWPRKETYLGLRGDSRSGDISDDRDSSYSLNFTSSLWDLD